MSKPAIHVEGLGKEYVIGGAEHRHESFREMLTGALGAPFRKFRTLGGGASCEERFWALKDVGFSVDHGEAVGIIGRNGAGKSTLLKVLSRITSPTTGRVVTRGRLSSLLEVGTGFHPELTGRENIYLNGAILGMSRREIDTKFDRIVEFSETERFLDTPVKRYSSGMYVRLAFAVAAHLGSDILIVDEVLAVGDTEFQKRCLGKMSDVAAAGRTVLFVSHNMNAIQRLCGRAILLDAGEVRFDGKANTAINTYLSSTAANNELDDIPHMNGELSELVSFSKVIVETTGPGGNVLSASEPMRIIVHGHCADDVGDLEIAVGLSTRGLKLASAHDARPGTSMRKGSFTSIFQIEGGQLRPGRYSLSVGANRRGKSSWCWADDVMAIDLEGAGMHFDLARNEGVLNLRYERWRNQP